jgi:hypothetical protein
MTQLKSQTDSTSPFSSCKGKILQKYINDKYPHIIQVLWLQKKVGGCQDLIFGLSGVNDTTETGLGVFQSDYLGEYYARCKTVLAY